MFVDLRDPSTVPELFLARVRRTPYEEAFRHPANGGWTRLTWMETQVRVRTVSSGLRALGVRPEQVCAILAGTRIEWILVEYGILCAGAAASAIYPSSTAEECVHLLADSGAVIAFAENDDQVAKLVSRRRELPALRQVVTFDGHPGEDGWVITLGDLEEKGRARNKMRPFELEETAPAIRQNAVAALVYGSGASGEPRRVELTHAAWVAQSRAIEETGILDHADPIHLWWLPLAHPLGRLMGIAQLRLGFPTAVDGRIEKLLENFGAVRPTFVCALPRLFEKVFEKVRVRAREGVLASAIFRWSFGVGRRVSRASREGRVPGPLLAARHALAERLVFRRVRALFGGRLRFFMIWTSDAPMGSHLVGTWEALSGLAAVKRGTGLAGLSEDAAGFFDAVGIAILDVAHLHRLEQLRRLFGRRDDSRWQPGS